MEVYDPQEDSELLRKHVKDYAKGFVLDMGTGSGIIAEEAAKSKRVVKVFGVDVNHEAIKYCIRHQKSKKIIFAISNLFTLFTIDDRYKEIKFDTIFFNAPYLPNGRIKDVALDGGKKGYELICKFIHQAERFLRPKGRILLVFSSLTGIEQLEKFLVKNWWNYKLVDYVHIAFEDIFLYEITKNESKKRK